jgi:hypothetical protein
VCNVRVQSKVALTSADCHSLFSFSMRSLLKLFFAFCVFFIFNAIFALHKVGVVRCDEVHACECPSCCCCRRRNCC